LGEFGLFTLGSLKKYRNGQNYWLLISAEKVLPKTGQAVLSQTHLVTLFLTWVNFGLSKPMEDVDKFYGHLVYFTVIWFIWLPFCIFYGQLVYFFLFGKLYQEKSGSPARFFRPRRGIEILELEQVCWHRSCKYFWGKNTL
jgi:hypothetical protein